MRKLIDMRESCAQHTLVAVVTAGPSEEEGRGRGTGRPALGEVGITEVGVTLLTS